MKNSWIASCPGAIAVSVVFVLVVGVTTTTEGRPPYLKAMAEKYPNLKGVIRAAKCNGCHPAKNKKVRNHYGEALRKALHATNVKDPEPVPDAFEKIESEPSAIKGKTFGDLIRMGKHPASTK